MNRLLKILVIFFMSFIITLLIYKRFSISNTDILFISDSLGIGVTSFNKVSNSYVDYFNDYKVNEFNKLDFKYKDLYEYIYYDKEIVYKNEYINIKRVINSNKYIIISLSNKESFKICNKSDKYYIMYLEEEFEYITKIIDLIYNINKNIIILSPYCNDNNSVRISYINDYYDYKGVYFINMYDILNKEEDYILINYPSRRGHFVIYDNILNGF